MEDEPWDVNGPRAPMPKQDPPSLPPRSSAPPAAAFTRTSSSSGPPAAAFSRSSSSMSRSSFQDDDMQNDDPESHSRIRQEALRMLEVADSGDSNYAVHRTRTGGFTATPRSSKPRALSGLNFVADRKPAKRYSDNPPKFSREEYEYGDDSVVDVMGLESRAAEVASTSKKSKNWSSRYSIDSTMLAMSGGAIKTHRESNPDRMSATNLFKNSPTKNTNVFGSGFSFRQKHVFGKQNVTLATDNIQSVWKDTAPLNSSSVKTWQEQILLKRQKRRRMLIALAACLLITVPTLAMLALHRHKIFNLSSVSDISFFVTADGPYNEYEMEGLRKNIARMADKTQFTVHLGNIGDQCDTYGHGLEVANMFAEHSPHRVFIIPGQNDWNECDEPIDTWEDWWENFSFFDKRWDHIDEELFLVYRQRYQLENWGFVRNGVLFLGVHAVNGNQPDPIEFEERGKYNYRWVMGMSKEHHDDIRSVVVFGNARPGYPENASFFAPLEAFWRDEWDKPVLYLHSSSGNGKTITHYTPFNDVKSVTGAQLDTRSASGPMRVTVGGGDNPFSFHTD